MTPPGSCLVLGFAPSRNSGYCSLLFQDQSARRDGGKFQSPYERFFLSLRPLPRYHKSASATMRCHWDYNAFNHQLWFLPSASVLTFLIFQRAQLPKPFGISMLSSRTFSKAHPKKDFLSVVNHSRRKTFRLPVRYWNPRILPEGIGQEYRWLTAQLNHAPAPAPIDRPTQC
jgi:hypothetical protein